MHRNDTVQFCYRLNLKNPDHLMIYQTLKDLNLDIHKSIASFTIECLRRCISGTAPDELTNAGKKAAEEMSVYVTSEDLEKFRQEMIHEVRESIMKDIMGLLFREVSGGNRGGDIRGMPESVQETNRGELTEGLQKESNSGQDSETEQALSELTDLWS